MRHRIPILLIALIAAACGSGGSDDAETTSTTASATTTLAFASAEEAEHESTFVRNLQEELDHLGYHAGAVDGVWGPNTSMALAAFQTDNGLDPTGDYDAGTAMAVQTAAGDATALTVESLQQQLEELGFYSGLVDGDFGPATEEAVLAFQQSEGLAGTGTLDHETFLAVTTRHATDVEQAHIDAATANGIGGMEHVPTGASDPAEDDLQQGSDGPEVMALQQRLSELGYRPGTPDGRFGAETASAVLAFQEREGLERDSIVGPEVDASLANPQGGGPRRSDPGPRVEVDLDRQIMFVIDAEGNVTTLNVSTGSGKQFQSAEPGKGIVTAHTPTGEFMIQRSIDGLRKAPLGTLYRPLYFDGGWAIHGNPHVPGYPASHGCVRTANWDQDFVWTVMADGDPVWIYGNNPDRPDDAEAGA